MAVIPMGALPLPVKAEVDVLDPEDAFRVSATRIAPKTIEVVFMVAPGYQLYRDRLSFRMDHPDVVVESADLPDSLEKFDPAMGERVRLYTESFAARLRLSGANVGARLTVSMQGCAVELGLCFLPMEKAFNVPPI